MLTEAELAWLDRTLTTHRGTPTLVCMHHPPLATVESAAMDPSLFDAECLKGLEAVLAGFAGQVKGVVSGHIHQVHPPVC